MFITLSLGSGGEIVACDIHDHQLVVSLQKTNDSTPKPGTYMDSLFGLSMDEPLKQFDIAPTGELHDRMRHALPEGHRIEWHAIGGFNVGTSGIAIGDPYELPEHESLPFPEGFAQLEALVFVDEGDQILCVAGFKITAEDAKPNSIRESEDLNLSLIHI